MTHTEIIKTYTKIADNLLEVRKDGVCLFWALSGFKLATIKIAPPEVNIADIMLEMDNIRNSYLRENYGWEI